MSDEQEFLHKLARLLDREHQRHQEVQASPHAWEIQPGSPLAGDEAKSHPHDVGHGAWHALTVAQDHLLGLHSSLHGTDRLVIHTHAQFTLLRAGMENAARAVWLLHPADRPGRVTRRLAMQRAEIRAAHRIRGLLSNPGAKTLQQDLTDLYALLATALGVTAAEAEKTLNKTPASYKDMVRDAAPAAGYSADTAELIWSACSALAHGDTHGTLSVLDKQVTAAQSAKGNRIALARVTGSVSGLYWCTLAATSMLSAGYDLYAQRARAPY
ncbi:hypothetical protein [Actinomadura chibensis]|uniref:Uncharacterized protein n=1 Tax=Actinomadura chibensis TaxID=392828 RepID=A0A5D0NHP6_9ACTN|nr:hypothetical protein [Actinomadura chibensis]TYB43859.1 hypothetical protein FXF69_23070 [Actinomadura chibensis]